MLREISFFHGRNERNVFYGVGVAERLVGKQFGDGRR